MKRAALFIALSCIILSGCQGRHALVENKLQSVNIALDDWVGYGIFYLAQEKGFCREEGIDLNIVVEPLDSARRDAFAQGMLDFEASCLDLLIAKAAQGVPLIMVMEIDRSFGGDAVVARKEIKSLSELLNRKIVLARDDAGENFIACVFYKNNLPFSSLKIIPSSPDGVADEFLKGNADACVTWEPQVSKALGRSNTHILINTKDYPGIVVDTLNARKDFTEKKPDLVKGLMRAWFKALAYYNDNPDESSKIISRYYDISPAQYIQQVTGLKWNTYADQSNLSRHKEWSDVFNMIVEVKFSNGRISNKPKAEEYLNTSFLRSLYEDSE